MDSFWGLYTKTKIAVLSFVLCVYMNLYIVNIDKNEIVLVNF